MPFKLTKKGYVQSKSGKLKLPPASPALAAVEGLKITWNTPVLPAKYPNAIQYQPQPAKKGSEPK